MKYAKRQKTSVNNDVGRNLHYDTTIWCVTYLWQKGFNTAGSVLLSVVPKEYAEKRFAEMDF